MPTEAATNISELDKNNPASTAPAGEGDDHLRMIKDVLLVSFEALDGPIVNSGGDQSAGNTNPPDAATYSKLFDDNAANNLARFPVGGIIMWAGLENEIPATWYLCDGLNGTPDLRNRFILAADYDPANSQYTVGQSGGEQWNTEGLYPLVDGLPSLDPSITVNTDTGVTNANLNQQAHEHPYLPPFYALAYIQYKGV